MWCAVTLWAQSSVVPSVAIAEANFHVEKICENQLYKACIHVIRCEIGSCVC